MTLHDLLGGFLLGLLVACPIGPVSLTCIRNSIIEGPMTAVLVGLGAAFGHGLFALTASVAAAAITAFMAQWQSALTLFSACLLIGLGLSRLRRTLRRGVLPTVRARQRGMQCLNGLLLAASNPLTVLPYLAFAASVAQAAPNETAYQRLPFAAGAALGAATWYLFVTTVSTLAGRKIGSGMTGRLDAASGIVLVGFGCLLLARGA